MTAVRRNLLVFSKNGEASLVSAGEKRQSVFKNMKQAILTLKLY